jgi:hypothetical protein
MKHFSALLILFIFSAVTVCCGQQFVDKKKFFSDTSMLNATLTVNMRKVLSSKNREGYIFPGKFSCKMDDGMNVNDDMFVELRGHFRRGFCYVPPMKLIFKNNSTAAFYHLKSLKLVSACKTSNDFDQYLLKEFICYKIFNLITDKSFRVRLLNLNYQDSSGKRATITQHAFLMEDIKELAKRNGYTEWTLGKVGTEGCYRQQTTLVAIFEYMIGNTDWAIPANHNIKLIRPVDDSLARPTVVPYDFDYSGLVNTTYAVPDEKLGTDNVRERLYRGFPRTMEELNIALDIFKQQKPKIYALINNFNLLAPATKKEMTSYLDEFYDQINQPKQVKSIFITNARRE